MAPSDFENLGRNKGWDNPSKEQLEFERMEQDHLNEVGEYAPTVPGWLKAVGLSALIAFTATKCGITTAMADTPTATNHDPQVKTTSAPIQTSKQGVPFK
jgi:hypothetical protein